MALPKVEAMQWDEFADYWSKIFKQGQHVAIAAPTGEGKTTLAGGLLDKRKYVLALDQKGGDETLSAFPTYRRITKWPDRSVKQDIEDGKPARLILGKLANELGDLDWNVEFQIQVLLSAWRERGWTIYIPDIQLLTDRRLANLGAPVDRFLIAARDRKMSVVSDMQSLKNVSKLAYRMSSYFAIGYTRDLDSVADLGEAVGRSASEMRGAIRALGSEDIPEHCWLIVPRRPRDPIVVTRPPEIRAKARAPQKGK